ncbi:MAG: hypothetical protein K2K23_03610 [Muribaculaceae bacterium]|nr:hypothetical protein [Muribaculaceae bacterium]
MITLIIILTMLAVILAIALAVSLKGGREDEDDRPYRDQDGDHVYYDKSIIEKKRFSHLHPKEAARTFSRLFGRRNR